MCGFVIECGLLFWFSDLPFAGRGMIDVLFV